MFPQTVSCHFILDEGTELMINKSPKPVTQKLVFQRKLKKKRFEWYQKCMHFIDWNFFLSHFGLWHAMTLPRKCCFGNGQKKVHFTAISWIIKSYLPFPIKATKLVARELKKKTCTAKLWNLMMLERDGEP